uniref:Uncharacterized protein n=1 Tax=Candidatus Methanophaga sp. ANME-1 ERB7 TaxID=2759913 RepID=A0A7G9Z515_9EURY|nr:hypothetical protein LFMFKLDH_00003 [Methanosarcinales archaeon ANME-1 ERB7]
MPRQIPHELVKRRSNKVAKGLLFRSVIQFYNAAKDKLEALIRIAAAANSMEYGVKGYLYRDEIFRRDFLRTLNEKLNWDRCVILLRVNSRDRLIYRNGRCRRGIQRCVCDKGVDKNG